MLASTVRRSRSTISTSPQEGAAASDAVFSDFRGHMFRQVSADLGGGLILRDIEEEVAHHAVFLAQVDELHRQRIAATGELARDDLTDPLLDQAPLRCDQPHRGECQDNGTAHENHIQHLPTPSEATG